MLLILSAFVQEGDTSAREEMLRRQSKDAIRNIVA